MGWFDWFRKKRSEESGENAGVTDSLAALQEAIREHNQKIEEKEAGETEDSQEAGDMREGSGEEAAEPEEAEPEEAEPEAAEPEAAELEEAEPEVDGLEEAEPEATETERAEIEAAGTEKAETEKAAGMDSEKASGEERSGENCGRAAGSKRKDGLPEGGRGPQTDAETRKMSGEKKESSREPLKKPVKKSVKKKKRSLYDWNKKPVGKKRPKTFSKHPIFVRGRVIGEGIPKICIPVVGADETEILSQMKRAAGMDPDLIEWRADYWSGIQQPAAAAGLIEGIRDLIGDIPLLFTVRSVEEGGKASWAPGRYETVLLWAAGRDEIDLIDVEGEQIVVDVDALIRDIHSMGKKVIASFHDFDQTPKKEEMVHILEKLANTGADAVKLAVMPESAKDVLKLMEATETCNRRIDRPIITMAMGELGVLSRVSGRLTGSAITFGSAGDQSAPGQLDAGILRRIMQDLGGRKLP